MKIIVELWKCIDVPETFYSILHNLIIENLIFEKVCYSILASSQRKLHGYIEIFKFDITIKAIKKFKLV